MNILKITFRVIRKFQIVVILFVISIVGFNLQVANGWGGGRPPLPSEVANIVNSKWQARDFNDLDSYITTLYSSFPNYIPAILASSFHDFIYEGRLSDAMQKFNQVKQWVEQHPGVVSEDFISQMYVLEWMLQSEIDMYERYDVNESELQSDPNAVRDLCDEGPFPPIDVLEYCDFAVSQIRVDKFSSVPGISLSASRLQQDDPLSKEAFEDANSIFLLNQTNNKEELIKLTDEYEKKWFQKDKINYFNFIGLFASKCNQNADKYPKDSSMYHELSDRYTKMALDKLYNLPEYQKVPVQREINLTRQINKEILSSLRTLYQKENWSAIRREAAKYYFCAWERLEKSIDTEEEIEKKINNVSYPELSEYHTGGARGMSPNSIKDPEIRTRYEKELNEYWEAVGYMTEQRRLRRMTEDGFNFLVLQRTIIQLYSGPEFVSKNLEIEALKTDISDYVKDENIASIILEGIQNRLAEDLKPRPKGMDMQPGPGRLQNETVSPPGFDKEDSGGMIYDNQ